MDINYKYKMVTLAPISGIIQVPPAEPPDLGMIPTTVMNEALDEPSPEPRGQRARKIAMARNPDKRRYANVKKASAQPSTVACGRGTKRKFGMDHVIKEDMDDLSAAVKENQETIAKEADLREKLQEMRKTFLDLIKEGKVRYVWSPDSSPTSSQSLHHSFSSSPAKDEPRYIPQLDGEQYLGAVPDCSDEQTCHLTTTTTMDLDSLTLKEFKYNIVETWDLCDLAEINITPLSCEDDVPDLKDLSDWRKVYEIETFIR
jgi:hypothetical protein